MKASVRAELNRIEKFLLKNTAAAADLWNILAALRGPDHVNDQDLKSSTTVNVRRRAFPKLARPRKDFTVPATFYYTRKYDPNDLDGNVNGSVHFRSHIRAAMEAITTRVK